MTDPRICPECEMEFDWPGVEVDDEVYCCEACSLGEPCECAQHDHTMTDTDVAIPGNLRQPGPL